MKNTWALAAMTSVLLTGCDIWFGTHCEEQEPTLDAIGLLNPLTGQCEYRGGSGGGSICGDYGGGDVAEPAPADLAQCFSECTGLAEEACTATPGCRAAYVSDCPEGYDCDNTTYTYAACWAVAPSGPVQGGECTGLDAWSCSRHDDCVAMHFPGSGCGDSTGGACPPDALAIGNFEACAPEATVAPAASCYGEVYCDALPPECPAGTVPGIAGNCWTGDCIAYDQCDPPLDPGSCHGEVYCDSLPPECPDDATPGVIDGCWSGYCVPLDQCEEPACEEVQSEPECIELAGCVPVYEGVDCSCDSQTGLCSCGDWVYRDCTQGA